MRRILLLGLIILALVIVYYGRIPCNNNTIYILPFPERPLQSIIFYIESFTSSALNIRQACAIESAARHHLKSKVKVFILSSKPLNDNFSLNHSLSNINLIQTNYESIFRGTPLEHWYQREIWKKKTYPSNYISDAIRFLLIWKYGGIYLDTDVIVVRSLRSFKNFVIKESDSLIMTAVFGFQEKHPFSSLCLDHLEKNYERSNLSNADITIITGTLMEFCNVNSLDNIQEKYCKIYTLPSSALFPFPVNEWSNYFNNSRLPYVLSQMKDSYMIHTYSSMSQWVKVPLDSGTALEEVMRSNCPLVYHHVIRGYSYI